MLNMKTFSLTLAFLILMIKGSKQLGQVKHQQNLKISNIFPANDRVRSIKMLPGFKTPHCPWMTHIQILNKKTKKRFKCGGSIINNYWILSAGHCICEELKCKPSKQGNLKIDFTPQDHIRIVTGLKDLDLAKKHQVSKPDRIIIHHM